MSAGEPGDDGRDGTAGHDETFLSRWSRRKAQSREQPSAGEPVLPPDASAPADAPATAAAAIELPDLDLLGEDSDYSAFLTPGVDADLRRRALRKLFSSPKFNVFDGLDTYRDDYTEFPALGSVVTADMRHHLERLARKAGEALVEQTSPAAPVEPIAPAAVIAATEAEASATPAPAAVEPPAPDADEETHDSPA